jgi:hypothetical protein
MLEQSTEIAQIDILWTVNHFCAQCRRDVAEAGKNYRDPAVRKGGPVPDYIAYVFVFRSSITICRLYK